MKSFMGRDILSLKETTRAEFMRIFETPEVRGSISGPKTGA